MSDRQHFLLLTYPVHSHINPTLQLARRLISLGAKVTFATSASTCRGIANEGKYTDIDLVEFPDNFIKGFSTEDDSVKLKIRQSCSATLAKVISTSNEKGWPVTCSVYTPTVPWVMGVVQELPLPSVLLWTQPAAVLVIYYCFFFGYGDDMMKLFGSEDSIELPGLPFSLKARDLPTFLRPVNPHPWGIKLFEWQTKWIAAKENNTILINTFESLEPDALMAVKELNMIPVGPLIPLDIVDAEERSGADCVKWMNSKPDRSVLYVSFGSIWDLSSDQTEEVARALLDLGRPFLWIIRTPKKQNEEAEEDKKNDTLQLGCMNELEQLGLVVPWCIQHEVLSHKSIGCFLTHCGWNSTSESLAAGVPMVGIPLWVEQVTNAKLVQEYWKCGVRACANEDDLAERDEIRRCVELVMGDEEMKESARKWKELAVRAAVKSGPADVQLIRFLAGLKPI